MKTVAQVFCLAAALTLGACQTSTSEKPVTQPAPSSTAPSSTAGAGTGGAGIAWVGALDPMAKPEQTVGGTWTALRDGIVYSETLIARDGDLATYRNGDGCEWTDIYWGFAPTLSWANCSGAGDGANTITKVTGGLWPLEVGKTVRYDYSGVGKDGSPWQAVWRCEVEAQERITVVSGEYDAFKVVCDNPWTLSTTHVAPRVNNVVAITRTQKDQNQTSRWEMVRYEPAKPSS